MESNNHFITKGEINLWDAIFGKDDKTKEALEFLTKYKEYLQFQNAIGNIGNMLVWGYIKFVYKINTFLEGLLLNSFDVGGFLKSQGLNDLQSNFVIVLSGIFLAIAAVIAGMKMMINRKKAPDLKDLLLNLFISVFILVYGGSIINDLFDLSKDTFTELTQIETNAPSIQLIQDNTDDLTIVLENGIENIKPTDKLNNITKDNFLDTNMNATITPDDLSDIEKMTGNEESKYLEYEIDVDNKGTKTAVPYKDNWLSKKVAPSGYRRFAANRLVIAVGETSLIIGYIFIIFSIIMCIFELSYKKVYLGIVVATDIETGQRRNKALEGIVQSLLLISFTGLELNIYMKVMQFLGETNLNPYIYVISMVVATFSLFKGSQAVSQLFGVDTSIKNNAGSLTTALAAAGVLRRNGRMPSSEGGFVKRSLNRIRNKGNNPTPEPKDSDNSPESSTNKPKPSLADRAKNVSNKAGNVKGYLSERKLSGVVGDGLSTAGNTAKDKIKKPFDTAKDMKDGIKGSFNEGVTTGLVKGYEKNKKTGNTTDTSVKPHAPTRNVTTDAPSSNIDKFKPEERTSSLSNLTDSRNNQGETKDSAVKSVSVSPVEFSNSKNSNLQSSRTSIDRSQSNNAMNKGTVDSRISSDRTSGKEPSNSQSFVYKNIAVSDSGGKVQEEKNKLKNTLKGK